MVSYWKSEHPGYCERLGCLLAPGWWRFLVERGEVVSFTGPYRSRGLAEEGHLAQDHGAANEPGEVDWT